MVKQKRHGERTPKHPETPLKELNLQQQEHLLTLNFNSSLHRPRYIFCFVTSSNVSIDKHAYVPARAQCSARRQHPREGVWSS